MMFIKFDIDIDIVTPVLICKHFIASLQELHFMKGNMSNKLEMIISNDKS